LLHQPFPPSDCCIELTPVTILLDRRLPAGPWDAHVSLHSGLLDRSTRATITFPATNASSRLDPVIAGLVGLLLLSTTTLLVMRKRRRS
jgi:LPXTG-motif cell wall-anchored protein